MNSTEARRPIGGYFELELPKQSTTPYPQAGRFQSARAAFLALLRTGRPRRVWLPKYICDAMAEPLARAGTEVRWYEIDGDFAVDAALELADDDWLLYVNYFGICDRQAREALNRFRPGQVVLDHSQAIYSPPAPGSLATIYSLRKFFGVPDGGLLVTDLPVALPAARDEASLGRMSHLLKRLSESPEAGYADYRRAEDGLSECEPMRMSHLTERLWASVDYHGARSRRRDNFLRLHRHLAAWNRLPVPAGEGPDGLAPLCYPFLGGAPDLRARLLADRVFVPTYWQDALGRQPGGWTQRLVQGLLPLPIDARYGDAEMDRMASIIVGGERNA